MNDTLPSSTTFSVPSSTLLPKSSHSPVLIITLTLLVLTFLAGGVYFAFFNKPVPVKVAVVDSKVAEPSPIAEEPLVDPIFATISSLTDLLVWSEPAYGSLMDSTGADIPGLLTTSDELVMDDESILPILSADSPLIVEHGWTQIESQTGVDEELVVYQKGSQKLYIKYQDGAYSILLAELL